MKITGDTLNHNFKIGQEVMLVEDYQHLPFIPMVVDTRGKTCYGKSKDGDDILSIVLEENLEFSHYTTIPKAKIKEEWWDEETDLEKAPKYLGIFHRGLLETGDKRNEFLYHVNATLEEIGKEKITDAEQFISGTFTDEDGDYVMLNLTDEYIEEVK